MLQFYASRLSRQEPILSQNFLADICTLHIESYLCESIIILKNKSVNRIVCLIFVNLLPFVNILVTLPFLDCQHYNKSVSCATKWGNKTSKNFSRTGDKEMDPGRRACLPWEVTQEHQFRTKFGFRSQGLRYLKP